MSTEHNETVIDSGVEIAAGVLLRALDKATLTKSDVTYVTSLTRGVLIEHLRRIRSVLIENPHNTIEDDLAALDALKETLSASLTRPPEYDTRMLTYVVHSFVGQFAPYVSLETMPARSHKRK